MADEQATSEPPLISVVMPVRNGMPWIEHQLRALAAQQSAVDWEVVVADNGSDDGTRSCVERWSERDPRIHLVDASARRGAAAARNIGVRSARGRLLAFCDADDVVRPGWLASMSAALADADLVAGVFDFGALDGVPTIDSRPRGHTAIGIPPLRPGRQPGRPQGGLRGRAGLLRGPFAGRGRRPVLAAPTGGVPVRRGRRCRRGEARAGRWQADVPCRLGLWTVRAAALRALPCGWHAARPRGAAKAWVWLVVASPGLVNPNATPSVGAHVRHSCRPVGRFGPPAGVFSLGAGGDRPSGARNGKPSTGQSVRGKVFPLVT